MSKIFNAILKLIILGCFFGGAYFIWQSQTETQKTQLQEIKNPKAIVLRSYLMKFNKPQKIEISSYTQRYENDVNEIKQMRVPLDEASTFYMTIQFFTDENDTAAPLVAQIRFMDTKSDNMVKEESINLE